MPMVFRDIGVVGIMSSSLTDCNSNVHDSLGSYVCIVSLHSAIVVDIIHFFQGSATLSMAYAGQQFVHSVSTYEFFCIET